MGESSGSFGRQMQEQHQEAEKWGTVPPVPLAQQAKKIAFEKLGNDTQALAPVIELISRYESVTRASQGVSTLSGSQSQ